jgi:dephospho-CoA kinase
MPLIGLTGSIGSGKTAAAEYLQSLGAYIIDADITAREAVRPGTEGARRIREHFGGEVFRDDGTLDRKKLADTVFKDENKRKALNDILHPVIIEDMFRRAEERLKEFPGSTVILAAPLLIETGMHNKVDKVWLITAGDETRIERIMRRDGCSREQAENRLASQMRDDEKRLYANTVICNDGEIEQLYEKLRSAFYCLGSCPPDISRKERNGK